ncbi:unnamed protein product [Prorocentrum cordatum]|uniref:Copper transporter n=1 Tax=Prorocentrum cordatum TaxID=2364126 RepID=A0ABN9QKJ5_9DINO|nr:unnamed protein product [Polarella glacialis]
MCVAYVRFGRAPPMGAQSTSLSSFANKGALPGQFGVVPLAGRPIRAAGYPPARTRPCTRCPRPRCPRLRGPCPPTARPASCQCGATKSTRARSTWTSRGARSWTRSIRIEMPDGTRCTVTPPGKWSFWMASEVAEMMCKAGVWVDGKGKPVLEIEMKTAQWFLIASAVTACVLAYLLYKMFYDTESSWYTWRQDQAVKWGFATAPPPPAEDADGAASASGPQAGINISISNASGSQPAPEAKPQ